MAYGNPEKSRDLKDFILEKINKEERKILDEAVCEAADGVDTILTEGIDIAMNKFN